MPEAGGADRALRLLGLARRAGSAVVGTRAVREAEENGALSLVVLAGDASGNARDRLASVLRDGGVSTVRCADGDALGAALGRGRVVAVGVTDPGLARQVEGALSDGADPEDRAARPHGRAASAAAPGDGGRTAAGDDGRTEREARDRTDPSLQKKI